MPDEAKIEAPAATPETPPSAPDPVAAFEARFAALEKATVDLRRENGTLRSQVAKLPRADLYIDALASLDDLKADLLAKGVSEDEIDTLAEHNPKALKAMQKRYATAPAPASDPFKAIDGLKADLEAVKAAKGITQPAIRGTAPQAKTKAQIMDAYINDPSPDNRKAYEAIR